MTMKAKGRGPIPKEKLASWGRGKWDPPPSDSYAARHLPNGKLTTYGIKMLLKEKTEEAKRQRDEAGNLV